MKWVDIVSIEQNYSPRTTVDRIKSILDSRNIGVVELSSNCGFGENFISQSRNSKDGMSARKLCAIADYLDCSTDYLLGRTDKMVIEQKTVIQTGDSSVNVIGSDISGNPSTNINASSDVAELVELIQRLPLVKRAEVILMIHKITTEEKE